MKNILFLLFVITSAISAEDQVNNTPDPVSAFFSPGADTPSLVQSLESVSSKQKERIEDGVLREIYIRLYTADTREGAVKTALAFRGRDSTVFPVLINRLAKNLFGNERLAFTTAEILVDVGTPECVQVLEDLLVYRWESADDENRTRKRKRSQFKESMSAVRAQAAIALGEIGAENSVPLLVKTLRNENNSVVREYVLHALLKFDDRTILPEFEKTAGSDSSPQNRILGVGGMSLYPSRVQSQVIRDLFRDDNTLVRLSAVKFLYSASRPELVPFAIEAADDPNTTVKRRIAELLAAWDTKSSADILIKLSKDRDSGVSRAALSSLGRLKSFPPSEYLKLCRGRTVEVATIILKSTFNAWAEADLSNFDDMKDSLDAHVFKVGDFTRGKIRKMKEIGRLSAEREKIKLILTDVKNKCKL